MFARLESPTEPDFAAHKSAAARALLMRTTYSVAPADTTTARSSGRRQPSHQSYRQHTPKNRKRPRTSQRNVKGADASAATRGVRDWRQDGGETTSKTPQLPRVASVGFRDGRSPPRAFLLAARVAVGTRDHRPLALVFGKRRQRSSLLCFIAPVCRFEPLFLAVRAAYRFRCVTVRAKHT